jgi:hypothetical protein
VASNRKRPAGPSTGPVVAARSASVGDAGRVAAEETARRSTIEDEIRLRAYYRYLAREGAEDDEQGDEMSDWLEAEADVLGRHATGVDADSKVRDRPPP